jgi:membrane-associated phospholipid phosphatase
MTAGVDSLRAILRRLAPRLLPALAALPLAAVVPALDPYDLPQTSLAGPAADVALALSWSGGWLGIPLLAAALLLLVLGRPGAPPTQRRREVLGIVPALAVVLGGGAWVNEHFVKERLRVPRPNLVELATRPEPHPILGMSVAEFYALPGKQARSAHLRRVLTPRVAAGLGLSARVREHWIAETGYGLPSGHAFTSMATATFFVALALACTHGVRQRMFELLLPWAVLVAWSRTVLRVHSPADIAAGGLAGSLVGLVLYAAVRALLSRLDGDPRDVAAPIQTSEAH